MLEINGKQFSDELIMAEYMKRSDEYLEWRQQKAAEFLQNKKRKKCYHCYTVETETSVEDDFFIPLSDDIINRVRALKEEIKNDPELKDDDDRADEFSDRIYEIGYDIENVPQPWPDDNIFTNIDLDDYIYLYHFDIHLFDWEGNANGQLFPATADLTDEEYIDLLAYLIDQPNCSFQHLAHLSPKFKAIYDKVSNYLHNYSFGVLEAFCHEHDYAIRMTELRNDAQTLLKQLKKKKEKYPYLNFLKDFFVNLSIMMMKRNANKLSPQNESNDSAPKTTESDDQQEQLAQLSEWIDQLTKGDNFRAADMLERALKKQIDKEKLTTPCRIVVKDDKIFLELPGKKLEELDFRRGPYSRALYIFFLRQIERANEDRNISPYLSQEEMKAYSDELLKIYERVGGRSKSFLKTLFLRSGMASDFTNTCSDIRTHFRQFLNSEVLKNKYGKCYTPEITGADRYGNPRYGINLDIKDFDLGWYSIDQQRI